MPASRRLPPHLVDKGKDPSGLINVAGLGRDDQDRVDSRQRNDPYQAGQGTTVLPPECILQSGGEILHVATSDGQQGVGLPSQYVDIECADQAYQAVACGGFAGDQQRIPAGVGGNLAALTHVGL